MSQKRFLDRVEEIDRLELRVLYEGLKCLQVMQELAVAVPLNLAFEMSF